MKTKSLSNIIMESSISDYCKKNECNELNISAVAKHTGTKMSSLWFYVKGERKWSVDAWLKTLACLGSLKCYGDVITIKLPKNKVQKKHLNKLGEKEYMSNRVNK